jgi:hypothetical protein
MVNCEGMICVNYDTGYATIVQPGRGGYPLHDPNNKPAVAAGAYQETRRYCPDYDLDAWGLPDYAVQAIKNRGVAACSASTWPA